MLLFIGRHPRLKSSELKLPGIGLPAIISTVAFLLFFGSHYLSQDLDQLEIILFLIGLVCTSPTEIFVFPGFGVFGMSGILLMLASIVLASHTFIWPTQDYEYQELGHTLLQLTGMLIAVGGCTVNAGTLLPLAAALQPPHLETRAMDRRRKRGRINKELRRRVLDRLAFLVGETGRDDASQAHRQGTFRQLTTGCHRR